MKSGRTSPRDDFDGPWKEVLVRLFPEFLEFAMPDLHALVDWSHPIEFQPQELKKILPASRSWRGIVDLLALVRLRGGGSSVVYCHVEAQAFRKHDFAERMFLTHLRLFEKSRRPIASIALLLDRSPSWRPDRFSTEFLQMGCVFRFRAVKVWDYRDRLDELRVAANPFAVAVRAHLALLLARTGQDRLESKRALARELLSSRLARNVVSDLFLFIDCIMRLPEELQEAFEAEVEVMQREQDEIYMTTWERQGHERGLKQGIGQGELIARADDVVRILTVRFGAVPAHIRTDLKKIADAGRLARLIEVAALAKDAGEFEKTLAASLGG